MTITLRTEYALRALIELANNGDKKPLSISQICKRQKLPIKFIEQIFSKLKNKEMIKSVRGKYGGYILAKPANEITMKDIIIGVDDKLLDIFCDSEHKYCIGETCKLSKLWVNIGNHFSSYFSDITLQTIIEKYQ